MTRIIDPECGVCRRLRSHYGRDLHESAPSGHRDKKQFPYCGRNRWVRTIPGPPQVRHEEQGPPCRCTSCPDCGPRKARKIELAIHVVCPELFLTINTNEQEPSALVLLMRRWRRVANEKLGMGLESILFIEPYISRPGLHVHLLAWGTAVSEDGCQTAAEAVGLGTDVVVREVYDHAVFGYGLKRMHSSAHRVDFLEANGGRLYLASRGFWRGPDGQPVRGGPTALLRRQVERTPGHSTVSPRSSIKNLPEVVRHAGPW